MIFTLLNLASILSRDGTYIVQGTKDIRPYLVEDEWSDVAQVYNDKWNFPNCVGAIDGKQAAIQCPPRGGSISFNYKKFHSIVLLTVVNANYEFTMIDIGDYGRLSGGREANYRSSRARRIVENAFGIATSRFRVFKQPICANVDTARSVVKVVVGLHNSFNKRT